MEIEDEVLTRDVEAQPHPAWFVEHKELLCSPPVEGENVFGFFILKVVKTRNQPPEAFTPYQYRFGLHNRESLAEKLDLLGPEGLKLSIAQALGLGDQWDEFCDFVVKNDEISSVFTCYGLRKGMTSWRNDQIKHVLALDALFLAVKGGLARTRLKKSIPDDSNNAFHSSLKTHWGWYHDLSKVENQIPFILIRRVSEYIYDGRVTTELQDARYLGFCMWYGEVITGCFMDIDGEFFKDEESNYLKKCTHILGAAYEAICGHNRLQEDNTMADGEFYKDEESNYLKKCTHILGAAYEAICGHNRLQEDNIMADHGQIIRISSASKLMASGIKIKGQPKPLCTMSYENKCLSLPKMRLYDETTSFIRNMSYYEDYFLKSGCLFHDYVSLIKDLIRTPGDLEVLIEAEVIENGCGERAVNILRALNQGFLRRASSTKHYEMIERIEKRCRRRRYRLWSEFKEQFCSKPWVVMSTIAITLVTLATLLQTYTAIIGSDRMKPQF